MLEMRAGRALNYRSASDRGSLPARPVSRSCLGSTNSISELGHTVVERGSELRHNRPPDDASNTRSFEEGNAKRIHCFARCLDGHWVPSYRVMCVVAHGIDGRQGRSTFRDVESA